jgi:hypothetical protein
MGKELVQLKTDAMKERVSNWQGPLPEGASPVETKAETPWWRNEGERVLNLDKVKDVQKYIMEGDA